MQFLGYNICKSLLFLKVVLIQSYAHTLFYYIQRTERSDHCIRWSLRGGLIQWKILKPVAFERMSFKKGSHHKALMGKMLVFWISDRLREVVAHEGSTILHSNYNWGGRRTTSIQTSCFCRACDALKFRTAEARRVNWP